MSYTDYIITWSGRQYWIVVDKVILASSIELSKYIGKSVSDLIRHMKSTGGAFTIKRVIIPDFLSNY